MGYIQKLRIKKKIHPCKAGTDLIKDYTGASYTPDAAEHADQRAGTGAGGAAARVDRQERGGAGVRRAGQPSAQLHACQQRYTVRGTTTNIFNPSIYTRNTSFYF